jgi:hypothetical protein
MHDESATPDRPRKKEGLEIHAVSGQFVIYEIGSDAIHYLNPTAALVLEFCDGDHSPVEIAGLVQEAYGLPGAPLAEVNGCLADLRTSRLVR